MYQKILARQWLALYQAGPRWVAPLVQTGFLSNLFLAFLHTRPGHTHTHTYTEGTSSGAHQSYLYAAAALLTISILPITFLYLEPGINGACKWKAELLLRDEGFTMAGGSDDAKGGKRVAMSVARHSASERSKRWAEGAEMGTLVKEWARLNHGRWALGVLGGVVSFWGFVSGRC